jgi:aminoglycoside phosphotransferase
VQLSHPDQVCRRHPRPRYLIIPLPAPAGLQDIQSRVVRYTFWLPSSLCVSLRYSKSPGDNRLFYLSFSSLFRPRCAAFSMDSQKWTLESLDKAFEEAQNNPSTIFLDSFGRRAFRCGGHVVKYGNAVNIDEAQKLSFIQESGLEIPVPVVYSAGKCGDIGFIEMEWKEGDTSESAWSELANEDKLSYARQLREIVNGLRSLEGRYIGSLEQGPAIDPRRSPNRGEPFQTEAAFNKFLLSNTISTTPTIYRKMLESLLPATDHKIVLTHRDLSPTNIIVKEGRVVGIVDWEYAGWYPEYWEFVQFFRALYADYRDFADIIFDRLYPVELMTDHFLGHLTRH